MRNKRKKRRKSEKLVFGGWDDGDDGRKIGNKGFYRFYGLK